jgi:uncharacterized protein
MIDTDARTTNERLVRSGYEAFAAGDLAAVEELFRPDAIWHAQRLGRLSGDHEGWPAIAGFFGLTMELSGGTFTVAAKDALVNDDSVAVVVRSRAERDDRRLDEPQVHLFRLEDGLVTEVRQFAGADADAFWS